MRNIVKYVKHVNESVLAATGIPPIHSTNPSSHLKRHLYTEIFCDEDEILISLLPLEIDSPFERRYRGNYVWRDH